MNADDRAEPWVSDVLLLPTTRLRQTVKHDPKNGAYGDCFRTAIACLIGAADPTEVPHFVADNIAAGEPIGGKPWADFRAAREWLRETHDLDLFPIDRAEADELGVLYKAAVISPAGVHHAVIACRGRVVWCPAGYPVDDLEILPDESAWVIARPYLPTPAGMIDEWRRADEVAS